MFPVSRGGITSTSRSIAGQEAAAAVNAATGLGLGSQYGQIILSDKLQKQLFRNKRFLERPTKEGLTDTIAGAGRDISRLPIIDGLVQTANKIPSPNISIPSGVQNIFDILEPTAAAAAARTGVSQFTPQLSCLLYTSPSPRDQRGSRMPSSA